MSVRTEDIRPFTIDVPEEQLDDLRRRITATKWPDRETDPSQGVRLETIQALADYWATDYDWRAFERALRGPPALHHRDRRGRHPLHPRPLRARGRVAAHRHPRVAGLDDRAAEDHRSAHQSHGARRERIGRLPPRDPVVAGPRVLGEADRDRLGPHPHRAGLGRADEPARVHEVRRAGRRLGQRRHRADGAAEARRGCSASTRTCRRRFRPTSRRRSRSAARRPPASPPTRRRRTRCWTTSSRPASATPTRWPTGRRRSTASPTRRSAWRPGCSTTTSRSYELIARAFAGQPGGLSRDDVLDNVTHYWLTNSGDLLGAALLGEQAGLLRRQGRRDPGRRDRLPGRAVPGSAELGGAGVSQAHPLQQGRRRRPLRRLGAAADLLGGDPGDVQVAAVTATAALPIEGALPDLGGATAWLNSAPLTPAGLRGKVVVVQFCTFSCINWLRTVPYVQGLGREVPRRRAGRDRRPLAGVPVRARPARRSGPPSTAMGVDYPIAVDNDFAVWRAFDNAYWPALYFVDADGRIRHHHFGEEDYERSERVIQQLLAEAGSDDVDDGPGVGRAGRRLPRRRLGHAGVAGDLRRLRPGHRLRVTGRPRTRPQPGLRASRRGSGSTSGLSPATGRWASRSPP